MIADDDREQMLDTLYMRFRCEKDHDERRILWNQIRLLHNGRSAARVEQLEREKGLR